MARAPRGTRDRQDALRSAAAVAGVVLALVLVMWAAVIGPSGTLRGGGPNNDASSGTIEERASGPSASGTARVERVPDRPEESPQVPWWVDATSVVAGLLLVLGLGLLTGKRVREYRRRRALAERAEPDPAGLVPLPTPDTVAEHAEVHRTALAGGTPRNAIVALWNRLELDVADSGVPRRPAETSAEFTSRFLGALDADRDAADRLAELYREARFSRHDLTEQHRAEAGAALERLHRSLRAGVR